MLHTVTIEAAPADLAGAYGGQLGWRIWRLSGESREAAAPPKPAAKPDLPPEPRPAIKIDPTTAIMLDSSATFGRDGHRVWIALTRDALRPVLAQLRAEDRRYRTYDRTVTAKGISVPVVVLIDVTGW